MVHASSRMFGAPGASRVFLRRRLSRIVPLYWVTTTAFLLLTAVVPRAVNSTSPGLLEIAASYAFIPWERADRLIQPVYSLGWTLNYEMFFYVVFALFLPLSRRRAVAAVAVALLGVVVAGRVFAPEHPMLIFWSQPIVLEFVLGMGLALLTARGVTLPSAARIGLAVLGLAALTLAPRDGLAVPPFMAGAGLLVAAAVLGPEPRLPSVAAAWMARLGDASYALYLVHPFVLRTLTLGWSLLALTGVTAEVLTSAAALVLACAVSMASHTWFEAPLTRGLALWTTSTRPART